MDIEYHKYVEHVESDDTDVNTMTMTLGRF